MTENERRQFDGMRAMSPAELAAMYQAEAPRRNAQQSSNGYQNEMNAWRPNARDAWIPKPAPPSRWARFVAWIGRKENP